MQRTSHQETHRTYSRDSRGILRTRIVSKIEDVRGEDQFGFEEGKEPEVRLGC